MRELSLAILELAENSIKAFATEIDISVEIDTVARLIYIMIDDNGIGADISDLDDLVSLSLADRTLSKLGLLLVSQLAESCGGRLEFDSEKGKGTSVKVVMDLDSVDLPPMGDLAATMTALSLGGATVTLGYRVDERNFSLVVKEGYDRKALANAINENIEIINGGNP